MNAPAAHAQPHALQPLAATICQAGWRTPALLLLTTTSPVGFVGRQLLLLTQPLWGASAVGQYAALLQQPAAWDELVLLLDQEAAPSKAPSQQVAP